MASPQRWGAPAPEHPPLPDSPLSLGRRIAGLGKGREFSAVPPVLLSVSQHRNLLVWQILTEYHQ